MQIIIVGLGKLGITMTKQLSHEGHSITVVDINNEKLTTTVDTYDVMGVCGNGATCETLEVAGASKAKLIIAATASDELNILCCLIANRMGTEHTIARVRNPDYAAQMQFLRNELGINMIVNPEYETANGVSPSLSELSEITGYSLEDIVFALNSSSSVTSLDSLINDESDSSMLNRIEDEASYFEEKTIDKIMISHILGTLKPRERQVIILRYYSGLTQKEISEKIGVSQVQVSRIEKKVLEKLRETV